ncbi:MAG: 23S rRNA (uracil(1939)-C(5))-methyltransferase RlmD, partial [Bacteroidetes bacterium]|nr:23S rRNA (uracil(1939)-C(5))-methyltransferase RlmD [Bacteroidota bacterium]
KKKNFMEGMAVKFHEYSSKRVEPFCEHYGLWGGCRWQNMNYGDQLFYKQKQVTEAFERIGKFQFPSIQPIKASPQERFYRNKLEYTFSNRRWLENTGTEEFPDMRGLGFHLPALYDRVVDIRKCHLQPDPSNAIRDKARELAVSSGLDFYDARKNTGFFRNLLVRNSNTGDVMVILVVNENREEVFAGMLDELILSFPEVSSWMYVINSKVNDSIADQEIILYKGKGYLEETMENLTFRIGPVSFFQVNTLQSLEMYRMTRDSLQLNGEEILYDLYTGTGTIANFVAGKVNKVVGLENIESAVEDAILNSRLNGIGNTRFISGDIARTLTPELFDIEGWPDVVITDPPRAGMHEKVINQILSASPRKIAYISCNPATQARDLAFFSDKYKIELVQPFDMFPHTQHVENLVIMNLKPANSPGAN